MRKEQKRKILFNLVLFILLFSIFFIIQKVFNIGEKDYYYDVVLYNEIGNSLFEKGHYSLFTIGNDFRGYIFPSFIGICNFINLKLGIDNSIHIISSIIFSLLFLIYLNFSKKLFFTSKNENKVFKYIKYFIPVILVLIFFYGLIIYPLTDLYAALLCIAAGSTIYSAIHNENKKKYLLYFLTGIIIYITYNIRTIYQLTIFLFIILIFIYEFKRGNYKRLILSILFYILGVIIAALPQFIINYNLYSIISPWINNKNLFAQQLFWGLEYPRYATAIGENAGGLYFVDNVGSKITADWLNSGAPISIASYIKYFFKYPLDYIGIIGRHFYNLLFILFPNQYVSSLDINLMFYSILSLIVVFIFCFLIYIYFKKNKFDWKKTIFIFVLIFPSLAISFGAVEERFMILPYLLIYSFIAFFDYSKLKKYFNKKRVIIISVLFLVFIITSLSIEGSILGDLKTQPVCFNNKINN